MKAFSILLKFKYLENLIHNFKLDWKNVETLFIFSIILLKHIQKKIRYYLSNLRCAEVHDN